MTAVAPVDSIPYRCFTTMTTDASAYVTRKRHSIDNVSTLLVERFTEAKVAGIFRAFISIDGCPLQWVPHFQEKRSRTWYFGGVNTATLS